MKEDFSGASLAIQVEPSHLSKENKSLGEHQMACWQIINTVPIFFFAVIKQTSQFGSNSTK